MKILLAFTAAVLSCVAFAFASEPLPLTVVSEPIAHDTTAHVTAVPSTVAAPYVAPVKVATVKARKRICDRRGNTVAMSGYATGRMVEVRNASDTTALVCWTE